MLDALERAGAPATFFLVGEQVEAHPGARAARSRRAGTRSACTATATCEHDELADASGATSSRLRRARRAATGVEARLFRPPYGRFSEASYEACRGAG